MAGNHLTYQLAQYPTTQFNALVTMSIIVQITVPKMVSFKFLTIKRVLEGPVLNSIKYVNLTHLRALDLFSLMMDVPSYPFDRQPSRYHSSLMTDNAFKTIIQADISDSDLQRLRCKVNRKCLKQK